MASKRSWSDQRRNESSPPAKLTKNIALPEITGFESKMGKGSTLQVVKRFNLDEEHSLTLSYRDGKAIVAIGEIKSFYGLGYDNERKSRVHSNMMFIGGTPFYVLLENWGKISSAISTKSHISFQIPESEMRQITVRLSHVLDKGYGLELGTIKTPEYETQPNEGLFTTDVFLPVECLEKITRAQRFIQEHLVHLINGEDAYCLMLNCFLEYIGSYEGGVRQKMYVSNISYQLEIMNTLDLKKDVIDRFKTLSEEREIEYPFNVYSLYSLCASQPDVLWGASQLNVEVCKPIPDSVMVGEKGKNGSDIEKKISEYKPVAIIEWASNADGNGDDALVTE